MIVCRIYIVSGRVFEHALVHAYTSKQLMEVVCRTLVFMLLLLLVFGNYPMTVY